MLPLTVFCTDCYLGCFSSPGALSPLYCVVTQGAAWIKTLYWAVGLLLSSYTSFTYFYCAKVVTDALSWSKPHWLGPLNMFA